MSNSERGRLGRISPVALAFLVVALLLGTTGGAVAGALITGAQIKDGTITGADIKNGSVGTADITNNSITNADITDESKTWGAVNVATTDNFTASAWTPLVSKVLTAPRNGFLTITGTLYAEDDISLAGVGQLSYNLRVDGKILNTRRTLGYGSDGVGETGALTLVVPVAKGSHTVQVVANEDGSGSFLYGAEISAIYSPTGGSSGLNLIAARPITSRANR